jgi:CDP-diacylglycerol--serine O-phosphatidyltransferase
MIVVLLSVLMVSRVRFRSFKDLRLTGKTLGALLLIGGASAATVLAGLGKAFIFLFLVLAYIVLGLAEEAMSIPARLAGHAGAAGPQDGSPVTKAINPEAPADEEVLRELGAFDGVDDEDAEDADAETGATQVKRA